MPGSLLNFLFFQNNPELWQIGIIGTLFLILRTPQLDEKLFKPFSGNDLVPSGKIIKDVLLESFLEPLLITVFRLLNLLDLLKWIGLRQAKAQPKKGINRSSLLIMLEVGMFIVCRKKDSHSPWWLAANIHGPLGIFSIPLTTHDTPHMALKAYRIINMQFLAKTWSEVVFKKGYRITMIKQQIIVNK